MSPSHFIASSLFDTPTHPELEGRRVLLCGIDDGCGELVARSLARQRTQLVLHSVQTTARAAAMADDLKAQATAVRLFAGGVAADRAACERLARAGLGAFGGLDLLINLIGSQPSTLSRARDLEDVVADELRPAMVLSRAVADHARNSGHGAAIMHVCLARSGSAIEFAHYALLKSGLEAMAHDQARRWFSRDICVYAFVPGLVGEPFDSTPEADNVIPARSSFDEALCAILLNAAGGRSRWLNGVTVAIPC